jgi:hypothetical protein
MTATQVSARELFRSAYENRYTWDANFPGYTADVTYEKGDTVVTGKAKVGADMKAEVHDVEDETVQKAIHGQLWETAIHRVRREFESVHGDNTFSYGDRDDSGAVGINIGGKGEGDRYQLRDNEVCMVHRHIHGVVVTIHTQSSHDTGAGYLSHRYDSVYHDPKTGEQKGAKSDFEDEYTQVGDYWILSKRTIHSADSDTPEVFTFSNIQLLNA